ncbi:MAG: hypothetical protein FWC73_08180 [Defluviitaleaceae bacterium]|nr:hypothetical protein [Defluviitaleaceae bacterium]
MGKAFILVAILLILTSCGRETIEYAPVECEDTYTEYQAEEEIYDDAEEEIEEADHYLYPETALNWQIAYAELLLEYAEKPSPTEWIEDPIRTFMLYDIEKTGVPALFIFYMAAGFNLESIYSYRDGEVIPINGGFFIYYYRAFPTSDGSPGILLINTLRHPGVPDMVSFRHMNIVGNELVTEVVLTHAWEEWYQWWDREEIPRDAGWFIDDRQVNAEEFKHLYDGLFRGWREGCESGNELFPGGGIADIHEKIFGWQPVVLPTPNADPVNMRVHETMPMFTFYHYVYNYEHVGIMGDWGYDFASITIVDEDGNFVQQIDNMNVHMLTLTPVPYIDFYDFNFDGYMDMRLHFFTNSVSFAWSGHYYWLWCPEAFQFVRDKRLEEITGASITFVDHEMERLVVAWQGRAGSWRMLNYYMYVNGDFVLIETLEEEVIDLLNRGTYDIWQVVQTDLQTGDISLSFYAADPPLSEAFVEEITAFLEELYDELVIYAIVQLLEREI